MDRETKSIHFQRQFLAPEQMRYDQSYCQSYVYLNAATELYDSGEFTIESELIIGDGHDCVNFDFAHYDEHPDEYLAMITKLMEQVIAYRQAYMEALALVRGQGRTSGGEAIEIALQYPNGNSAG